MSLNKNITFIFSKPINNRFPIFSWLIRLFENTKYSHVSMHFYSESLDRTIIYEAAGAETRFIGRNMWEKHCQPLFKFKIEITNDQYVKLMQHCIDTSGMKYGLKLAFGMVLAKVFSLKKNPFSDLNKKVCSTAIGELLVDLDYKIDKNLELLTPEDIFNILYSKASI